MIDMLKGHKDTVYCLSYSSDGWFYISVKSYLSHSMLQDFPEVNYYEDGNLTKMDALHLIMKVAHSHC